MYRMQQAFDKQVQNLIDKGYPKLYDQTPDAFRISLQPLREQLPKDGEINIEAGKLPFVIVVKSPNNEAETLMELVDYNGKTGFSKMYPHKAKEFRPIDAAHIPYGFAYLLIDIDRGKETVNVAPVDAFITIKNQGRSPLTIDEGIALITHYPEFLLKNNCFSLLASRFPGNKRVPAIWINAEKQPNLGWCWDGNPHTWLGSASCNKRVGTY